MKWRKLGLVYNASEDNDWARRGAMVPTPMPGGDETIRVYVGFCDDQGRSRAGYVDVSAADPLAVSAVSLRPVLDLGQPGTFDDSGVMPTSIVDSDGLKHLYYFGFQLGTNVRYFLFSGLATSDDGGESFTRYSRAPVLDRSDHELYLRSAPCVKKEEGIWRMWYVAGDSWIDVRGKQLPVYRIKYIESADGREWPREGKVCIDFASDDEHGFGRPYVVKDGGLYRLFYSIRLKSKGYRMGYAESRDGITWDRRDDLEGMNASAEGWDSQATCYSSVISAGGRTYMFYNGNNYGESGFGVAVLEDS